MRYGRARSFLAKLGPSRGLGSLLSGTIGGQVITLAAIPLIARLFSPDDFGYLALVLALAGAVAPAAMLRLETAAMLPDKIVHVQALFRLAILSGIIVSVVYGLSLYVASSLGWFNLASFSGIPVWVTLYIFSNSVFVLLSQLLLRKQLYSLVAKRSLLKAAATVVVQIVGGIASKATYAGLVLGPVLGNVLGVVLMSRQSKEFASRPPRGELRAALRRYWRFPAIFAPSALLNSLGLQVPIIYFVSVFGLAAGGQLGMAERIVAIPISLIGSAVGQLLEAEASALLRAGKAGIDALYVKYTLILGAVSLVIIAAGVGLSGLVVPWLLGPDWTSAGVLVQILSINCAVRLVASPLSKVILLLQRTMANTILDGIRVLLMFAAIIFSQLFALGFVESVALVYSSLTFTYVVTWCYGLFIVRKTSLAPRIT